MNELAAPACYGRFFVLRAASAPGGSGVSTTAGLGPNAANAAPMQGGCEYRSVIFAVAAQPVVITESMARGAGPVT